MWKQEKCRRQRTLDPTLTSPPAVSSARDFPHDLASHHTAAFTDPETAKTAAWRHMSFSIILGDDWTSRLGCVTITTFDKELAGSAMVKDIFIKAGTRKAARTSSGKKPKGYTKGWRDDSGQMNINCKIGTYGSSSTLMAYPDDKVSTLVRTAIRLVKMGDHHDVEHRVFFRKQDLSEYGDYQIRDLFDGNETIYVKEVEVTDEGGVEH